MINTEDRRSAEWFDFGAVVSKEANGLLYEVIANGTFSCTAPNGDKFESSNSATEWLVEHGITNDEELSDVMNDRNGWTIYCNRWFDLIISTPHNGGWMDVYCGEPCFEYDLEGFNAWIDEAITNDAKEEEE